MAGTVLLTVDELWECIYAARMQERYFKLLRRTDGHCGTHWTRDELDDKVTEAKWLVRRLENLAPEDSF